MTILRLTMRDGKVEDWLWPDDEETWLRFYAAYGRAVRVEEIYDEG